MCIFIPVFLLADFIVVANIFERLIILLS
jgi:hypothetical protein